MSDWVLIVDDHPLMRDGLKLAAREALPGCVTVAVGSAVEAAVEISRREPCKLVMLDFHLPDARGYSALLRLQDLAPATPIIIVTAREDKSLARAAETLDAAGYIRKTMPLDQIVAALKLVLSGQRYFVDKPDEIEKVKNEAPGWPVVFVATLALQLSDSFVIP